MTEKPRPKDEALEAIDFIVNVLKEHEKDLDRLVNELGTVAEQIGQSGELSGKVENINEKITSLQKEVSILIDFVTNTPKKLELPIPEQKNSNPAALPHAMVPISLGPQLMIKCNRWEDFQKMAYQAQMLTFNVKEEKTFEVNAVKGNQVINFCGELPRFSDILKRWLAVQLDVSEGQLMDGVLSLG
jgi:hypothetical protein